mgnify:CR=1 FL=1
MTKFAVFLRDLTNKTTNWALHCIMSTAAAPPPRNVVNPYAKTAQNAVNMGRQSQHRVSNQHKRKCKLAQATRKPKAGDQLTLDNRVAFQAECDCKVCKAKEIKKWMPSCSIPKRAHHPLCNLNAKTRGLGEVTASTLEENKRFKALMSTIHPSEKCSAKHMTKESAATFFQPRVSHPMTATIAAATASPATNIQCLPVSFGKTVGDLVKCADFRERHKNKGAPLAMIAFANEVTNHMKEQKGLFSQHFNGNEMIVPACEEKHSNPHCHSIVGSKFFCIDWQRTHGLQVPCPHSDCRGILRSDRTNFSKNKTLFPVFGFDGAPAWCIVIALVCPGCKR